MPALALVIDTDDGGATDQLMAESRSDWTGINVQLVAESTLRWAGICRFRPYYEINENKYDGILEWDLKADQIDGWAFSFGIVKTGHDGGDYIQFKKYYY